MEKNKKKRTDELDEAVVALKALCDMEEEEIEKMMRENGGKFMLLLKMIGCLVTTSCGDPSQLYEKVSALAIQQRNPSSSVKHVKDHYVEDISVTEEDGKVRSLEVKSSVIKKSAKNFKCNWNIKLNTTEIALFDAYADRSLVEGKEKEKKFELLANNLYKKVREGYGLFVAYRSYDEEYEYEIDGEFLVLYTIKKLLPAKCYTVNVGASQCKNCKEFHRLDDLCKWGLIYKERMKEYGTPFPHCMGCFSDKEWLQITDSRTASQCSLAIEVKKIKK